MTPPPPPSLRLAGKNSSGIVGTPGRGDRQVIITVIADTPGSGEGLGPGLGLGLRLKLGLGMGLELGLGLRLRVGTVKDERVVWPEPNAGEGAPVAVPGAPHCAGGGGQREAREGGQWLRRRAGRGGDARVEACARVRDERRSVVQSGCSLTAPPCHAASHPAESAARTRWRWRRRSGAR